MKRFLYFFYGCLFSYTTAVQAQWNTAFYVEGLGDGFIVASVNVDQRLSTTQGGLGIRLGYSIVDPGSSQFNIPMFVNYLFGKEKHFLEIGLGGLYVNENIELGSTPFLDEMHGAASLMYRLHSRKDLFLLRVGVSFFTNSGESPFLWPGLSLGFRLP